MIDENIPQTIGERLKALRKSKGFILKDIETKTKITAATLSNLENDLFKPSLSVLVKLAALYNESIDFIVNGKSLEGHQISFEPHQKNLFEDTSQSLDNDKYPSLSLDTSTRDDMLAYYEKALQLEKQFSEILKRENNILKTTFNNLLKSRQENGYIMVDDATLIKLLNMLR